jgi:hypothetical protein
MLSSVFCGVQDLGGLDIIQARVAGRSLECRIFAILDLKCDQSSYLRKKLLLRPDSFELTFVVYP